MTYPTIDEVKETFIDINMDCLLDLYDTIGIENEELGFMNQANSSDFIHLIVDSIIFNESTNDHSSDDET